MLHVHFLDVCLLVLNGEIQEHVQTQFVTWVQFLGHLRLIIPPLLSLPLVFPSLSLVTACLDFISVLPHSEHQVHVCHFLSCTLSSTPSLHLLVIFPLCSPLPSLCHLMDVSDSAECWVAAFYYSKGIQLEYKRIKFGSNISSENIWLLGSPCIFHNSLIFLNTKSFLLQTV